MRRLSLLGATGSIGASTLDVVAQHPDRFTVAALAAHRNWQKLGELCRRYQPALAVLLDEDAGRALKRDIAVACPRTRVACGAAASTVDDHHYDAATAAAALFLYPGGRESQRSGLCATAAANYRAQRRGRRWRDDGAFRPLRSRDHRY